MPHYGYINPLDIGAEPDDAPTGRCYGPAYPDSPGCGRFARGGMCARCNARTQAYWAIDATNQLAHERAMREQAIAGQPMYHPDDPAGWDLPF